MIIWGEALTYGLCKEIYELFSLFLSANKMGWIKDPQATLRAEPVFNYTQI